MTPSSTISQLLSVTHEIYKNFDFNLSVDIRGVRIFRYFESFR